MGDYLSLPDDDPPGPSAELQPSERALAGYRRQEGWVERAEPAQFLKTHPQFAQQFRPEHRAAFWGSPLALMLVLAGFAGVAGLLVFGNLRLKPFLSHLFHHPELEVRKDLSDYPPVLKEEEIPPGVREEVHRINEHLRARQWKEAVALAQALRANPESSGVLRARPRAYEWLYEVLVAGQVVQESRTAATLRGALGDFETYRREIAPRPPGFRLRYNQLIASFQRAGGTEGIAPTVGEGNTANESILQHVREFPDQFGTALTPVQQDNLRVIRAFTLARLLAGVPKDRLVEEKFAGGTEAERWRELDDLLTEWRRPFGAEESWPRELLLCRRWFLARVETLKPWYWTRWSGGDIAIAQRQYDPVAAGEALERIEKVLAHSGRK